MASASVCTSSRRPVGEVRAVGRLHREQVQPVVHPLAEGVEAVRDQAGHGQHGRAGVDPVGAGTVRRGELEQPGPAARHRRRLQHGHLATGAGQPHRRRQPGEPGTDDHDPVGWVRGPGGGIRRAGRSRSATRAASTAARRLGQVGVGQRARRGDRAAPRSSPRPRPGRRCPRWPRGRPARRLVQRRVAEVAVARRRAGPACRAARPGRSARCACPRAGRRRPACR